MCTSWVNIYDRKQVPTACVCVLTAQSCPTLWDPVACSPPGSSVHGNFQARILEWVAISFSRGSSQPRDRTWDSLTTGRFFTVWATTGSESENHSVVSSFFSHHGLQPARLLCPWNSAGKNTVVGSLTILQGIFQTQWLNQGLLYRK